MAWRLTRDADYQGTMDSGYSDDSIRLSSTGTGDGRSPPGTIILNRLPTPAISNRRGQPIAAGQMVRIVMPPHLTSEQQQQQQQQQRQGFQISMPQAGGCGGVVVSSADPRVQWSMTGGDMTYRTLPDGRMQMARKRRQQQQQLMQQQQQQQPQQQHRVIHLPITSRDVVINRPATATMTVSSPPVDDVHYSVLREETPTMFASDPKRVIIHKVVPASNRSANPESAVEPADPNQHRTQVVYQLVPVEPRGVGPQNPENKRLAFRQTAAGPVKHAVWSSEDRGLHRFDKVVRDNMKRYVLGGGGGGVGGGGEAQGGPPQTPQSRGRRSLGTITVTHRKKTPDLSRNPSIDEQTVATPPANSDMFKKFKFRFGSFGEFNRSNSNDGKEMFYFQDFDDLATRIRDLPARRGSSAENTLNEQQTCDCQYTCHHKCRPLISVDCQSPDGQQGAAAAVDELTTCDGQEKAQTDDADSGYHTGGSTLRAVAAAARSSGATTAAVTPPPSSAPTDICATREDLREKIQAFNNNNHGLIMTLASDEGTMTFQGFIRVYLNLIHPVNMSLSMETEQGETTQMTSFYLPKNTSKVVHINSDTSIQEVISALLSKFKITDNPRKYVLYEQITGKDNKATMHKLNEGDRPLPLCLSWTAEGLDVHKFVLHENDTGEIMWEAFSLPELENFLKILNREESEYIKQLKARYNLAKIQIQMALKDMPQPDDQREPVYV